MFTWSTTFKSWYIWSHYIHLPSEASVSLSAACLSVSLPLVQTVLSSCTFIFIALLHFIYITPVYYHRQSQTVSVLHDIASKHEAILGCHRHGVGAHRNLPCAWSGSLVWHLVTEGTTIRIRYWPSAPVTWYLGMSGLQTVVSASKQPGDVAGPWMNID